MGRSRPCPYTRRHWMKTSQLPHIRRRLPHAGLIGFVLFALLLSACDLSSVSTTPQGGGTGLCSGSHPPSGPTSSGDLGTPTSDAPIGQVPANQSIHLSISLAINESALDACVQSINTPSSGDYRHFLSPQDIAAHFAPPQSDIDAVKSFLTGNGLQVTQSYATNAALAVDGTAGQIDQAFKLTLKQYKDSPNGSTFYAPDRPATLPSNVQNVIQSINGLDNHGANHCEINGKDCTHIQHFSSFQVPPGYKAPQKPQTPSVSGDCTLASVGLPFLGGSTGGSLLTWTDLSQAYGFNTLKAAGFDGSGTTIGMVEFDTYDLHDVNNYELCSGTFANNRIQNVVVVPGGAAPDSGPGAGEAVLDMELAAGLTGPNTKIIDYYAPNNDQWEASLLDILHRAASDKKINVLSISYGDFERDMSQTYMVAVNDAMKLLASEGISVFVASGDCAAFGSGQFGDKALSFPASAPYAIAVGGTQLTTDLLGNRTDEQTWVNTSPDQSSCQNTWGSGGGLSVVPSFTLPNWQKGTGVNNQYSNGERQVPDVSAAAINISFYYDLTGGGGQGVWLGVGGTSAAAPIWAAGIDIVDQALAKNGKPLLGGVPNLYTLANGSSGSKDYTDITKGSNLAYPATKGWDYTTGWGAPQFDQIAASLGA
jgi:kumamolisin